MSIYTGAGLRCRQSAACGFRVLPAAGDDQDLNEAAHALVAHEKTCRFAGIVPDKPLTRLTSLDDRRGAIALREADEEEALTTAPSPFAASLRFNCTCKVCGAKFMATGPRSQFCPKRECQARRRAPVRHAA